MRTLLLSICVLAAACGTNGESDGQSRSAEVSTRYVNAASEGEMIFQEGWLAIGGLSDQQQARSGDSPRWGAATVKCSNETYLCLRSERLVFAVPKGPFSQGHSYSVEGVRFFVDSCADASCTGAEIRAVCEHWERGLCSLRGPQDTGNDFGTLLKFSYDRIAGVRSIELFPDTNANGRRFVLENAVGILSATNP